MLQELNLSEARAKLSGLIKKIYKNPDITIRITSNGIPMAELKSIRQNKPRENIGQALLDVANALNPAKKKKTLLKSISEDHDDYIY